MIRINLLGAPKPKRGKRPAITVMPAEGPSAWLSVVVVFLLAAAFNFGYYTYLDRVHRKIQQDIQNADLEQKRLAQVKAAYLEKQRQADLYKRRVDVIDQLRANQSGPVNLLTTIGETVNSTDAVWLVNMNDSGNAINIDGTALSHTAVANLIGNLKKTGFFKTIEIKESVQDPRVKDFDAFDFKLTCEKLKS